MKTHSGGTRGVRVVAKDNFGREVGSQRRQGKTSPAYGAPTSFWGLMQLVRAYGRFLMQNKREGIVAIHPEAPVRCWHL
ncbi:MAG: hypothetical protein R3B47_10900 [Bacteroidia bacterium]